MANGYINIANLYKRVPVLTDTNGDHLIAVSDLRTAIAMAAAETGEVHPMPCKIGDKVYTVLHDDEIDYCIVEELTVTEVGINGICFNCVVCPARFRRLPPLRRTRQRVVSGQGGCIQGDGEEG